MKKHTDETRIFLFVGKVKDLARRNGQDEVLIAIGCIYVILLEILEALSATFGQGKGLIQSIRDREE